MSGTTDSAVGAILNIPPDAIKAINAAEDAIRKLQVTSSNTANRIYNDFAKIMPMGVDVFIRKLAEAKAAIAGINGNRIELNVNTNNAAEKISGTARQIKADMDAISATVQIMARGFDFTNPENSIKNFLSTIGAAEAATRNFQRERNKMNVADPEIDRYNRIIELLKEYIEVKKRSEEKQTGITKKANDKTYLEEQKRLLADILDLRKQVNAQAVKVTSGRITGSSTYEKDKADLRELVARYREAQKALRDYDAEKRGGLSVMGENKARIAELQQENAMLKEQRKYYNDMISAISRRNELLSQPLKARMGSSDEAVVQRQLNTDYKEMLRIVKEIGEIKAKAAEQGRSLNQSEIGVIRQLLSNYHALGTDIRRLSESYSHMAVSAQKAYETNKTTQLARNAALLADAQNKAAQAAQKKADAEAKAEERAIAAGDKKIAQKEKQIAQQEERERKAAENYEKWWLSALKKREDLERKATEKRLEAARAEAQILNKQDATRREKTRATAIKSINDAQKKRISLLEKISALEEKAKFSKAGMGPTLTATETTNLSNFRNQLSQINEQIAKMRGLYPALWSAAEKAFNTRQIDLATDAFNRFNEAIAKTTFAKSAPAENELKNLYEQRLALLKEQEQINNRGILRTEQGKAQALTVAENERLQQINAQLKKNKDSIDEIAKSYSQLAIKAEQAFDIKNLRQTIVLQNQFNKAIDAINTSNVQKLTAEYKRLYAENQRLFESMRTFQNKAVPIGGSATLSTQYNEINAQWLATNKRMAELERMNIQEIYAFRRQKEMEANLQSIDDFVKAQAAKTAAAKTAAQQFAQSYAGALRQYENMMSGKAGGNLTVSLENVKRVLNDLQAAAGKLDILNPADVDKANQLKKAIQELQRIVKSYRDVTEAKPDKPIVTPQDTINAAKQATTLKQLQEAYTNLKTVMATTDPRTEQWKQMNKTYDETKKKIEDIKKAMGDLNKNSQGMGNILGQLGSRIAAVFSVQQIYGFLRKMTEVRAQFELQRVALGAIIQDRDEANKIFIQVQNMALESPFNIMQLEKATKQIAAFGFETQSLVPTMKMLADISAGLGVEIDRLVLVMGHLKARGFLEGTMLRQFTNMGFNVLGELSKYYTELENKIVSVGEVQSRVKKKMVSFADVEEVLRRVTSASGMFYDMQKKQSDSIWGLMQRIQDATDLMLNEIGQSHESVIKKTLGLVIELINAWRDLKPYILGVIAAFGSYTLIAAGMKFIPLMLRNIKNGVILLGNAIHKTKTAQQALNITMMQNPYAAVAAAVAALIVVVVELITKQNALAEAMDRIRSEGYGNMYELITQYKELADTVRDANEPYEERTKALEELNRVFGDILPNEMLELDNIKKMADGYKEVTEAIKAYSAEKIKANMQSEIDNQIGKEINNNINGISEDMASAAEDFLPKNMPKDAFKNIVKSMLMQMKEEVKSGDLEYAGFWEEFQKRLMSKFELIIPQKNLSKILNVENFGGDLMSLLTNLKQYSAELKGIDLGLGGIESPKLVEVKTHYQALTEAVKDYKDAITALRNAREAGEFNSVSETKKGVFTADTEEGQDAVNDVILKLKQLNQAAQFFGERWNITAQDVNDAIQSHAQEMNYFEKVSTGVLVKVTNSFDKWGQRFKNDASILNYLETVQKEADEMDFTGPQQELYNIGVQLALQMGVQIGVLDKLRIESINSFEDAAKAAKKQEDQLQQNILAMETMIKHMVLFQGVSYLDAKSFAEKWYGGGYTLEENKQFQELFANLKLLYGYADKSRKKASKSSKSTTDKELKRLQDLKKRLEEVHKKYEELRKTMSAEEANKRIHELFDPIFKDLGVPLEKFFKDGQYDAESLINALEVLLNMVKRTTQERKEFAADIKENIAETKIDIDTKNAEKRIEEVKRKIDDLFSNYELSKELENLGLNVNLAFVLGGEPIDLDELKARLTREYNEIGQENGPEEEVEKYKDAFKKISDLELKELKERAKKYYKYTVKAVGERAKIELEYLKMIDEVRETYALTERQRQEAIANLIEEKNKKLADQMWKDFKDSPIYQMMFDDIKFQPTEALKNMRDYIVNLKNTSAASMSFRQLQEISKLIKTIDEQIADRNPFKTLGDSVKDLFSLMPDMKSMEKDYTDTINRINELKKRNEDIEVELIPLRDESNIYKLQQVEEEIEKLYKQKERLVDDEKVPEDDPIVQQIDAQIRILHSKQKALQDLIDANRETEEKIYDSISDLESEHEQNTTELKGGKYKGWDYGEGLEKDAESYYETLNGIYDTISKITKAIAKLKGDADEIIGSIDNIVTELGNIVNLSDSFIDGWESTKSVLSAAVDAFSNLGQFAAAALTSKNPLEIIKTGGEAIGSIIKLVGAFTQIGDKKKERQIKKLKDRVDALKKSYEDLEEAMDEAFTFEEYNADYKASLEALDAQAKAYDEMIRLEEAKKKTDKDKVKEYKEAREEVEKARKELREARYEEYGSISKKEYQNEAEAFVSAWLDAYKETGDGLDGLIKHWDEFFENLVLKQAASAVVSRRMSKYMDMINAAIDRGESGLTFAQTVKNIGEQFKNEMGTINEELKEFWDALGLGTGSGEFVLSDLQQGIQNITEPQAAAIEAYLNSIRFEVYHHTQLLNSLVTSIQMQYGGNEENPMLSELKGIRTVLDNIYSALNSVVRTEVGRNFIQVG